MAIDPNISLGVRPIEIANPLAQYGQVAQIQAAQQAQQMNALKMQEAQATMEERNALRRLDPTAADYESQLFRVNPQLGINYRKEAATTAAQKAAETKSLTETAAVKQKMLSQALRDISDRPSDANITAHTEDIQTSSLFSQEEKAKALITQQTLLAIPFEQRQSYLSQQGATANELRPVSVAAGASLVGRDNKVVFTAPERQDTDLIRNFNAARAQGFGGTLFDYERKIKEAGRQPRAESAPRTQQVTLSDGTLGIVNMDTGVITRSTVEGASVKGKPSAFAEKAAAQKAQMGKDLGFAIAQLADITKDGGLIDQSTGSGAGKLIDLGAGFIGKATPGAIAIGKIAPVADLALKMIPRFEGPQSNADTKSYKEAAGQLADSSLPTEIRKQAGRVVLRLMKERQGQFVTSDMAAEGATAANPTQNVRSEADAILNGSN